MYAVDTQGVDINQSVSRCHRALGKVVQCHVTLSVHGLHSELERQKRYSGESRWKKNNVRFLAFCVNLYDMYIMHTYFSRNHVVIECGQLLWSRAILTCTLCSIYIK